MLLPIAGAMNENQLLLITFIGVKSIPRLVNYLEERVDKYLDIVEAYKQRSMTEKE
jgi:hypothetical protein